MRILSLLLLSAMFFSVTALPAHADEDVEKTTNIKKLFTLMQLDEREGQMLDLTISAIIAVNRQLKPEIPAAFWDESRKALSEEFRASLSEVDKSKMIIYAHHYTAEDVKQLVAFYSSPVGQKVLKESPLIAQESMAIGKAWGQDVGLRASVRLREMGKKKGYTL